MRTAVIIAAALLCAGVAHGQVARRDSGLVLWIPHDGELGTATDRSGAGNSAVVVTQSLTEAWALGTAFKQAAVTDYYAINDSASLSFGNGATDSPFTITMWAKHTAPITNLSGSFLITKRDAAPLIEWQVNISTNHQLRAILRSQSGVTAYLAALSPTNSVLLNRWQHYCVSYDGSSAATGLNLYIDGTIQNRINESAGVYVAMSNTSAQVVINTAGFNRGSAEICVLHSEDDVRIYNRALSPQEIASLYRSRRQMP